MTEYLTVEQVERIHALIVGAELPPRDRGLLEAAVARPATSAFGEDAYPTIINKAAALLHSLVMNHPFTDGNKRVGVVATIYFLNLNGYRVTWQAEDAFDFILEVAQGMHDVPVISEWLAQNTGGMLPGA